MREGWGLTVTEAAQLGTPAIAYDVAGLRDSVTASGGVLVAPSPDALADVLTRELQGWVGSDVLPVEAGGVLPWPTVTRELLDQAAHRVAARCRSAQRGEDVAVAWRQVVAAPLAAPGQRYLWCRSVVVRDRSSGRTRVIADHRADVGPEKGPERRARRNDGPWAVVADVGGVLGRRHDLGSSELEEAVTALRSGPPSEGPAGRSSSIGANREVTP